MEPVWNNKRTLMGSAAGVLILMLGGWGLSRSPRDSGSESGLKPEAISPDSIEFAAQGADPAAAVSTPAPSPTPSVLVVHVVGAVKRPGVYSFKPGDRIYNAIRAAGGFKPNARQDALNIANALQDADQIYVPTRAEVAPKQTAVAATARSSPPSSRKSYSVPSPSYGVAPIVLPRPVLVSGSPVVRTSLATPPETEARPVGRVIGKPQQQVPAAPGFDDAADPDATTPAEIVAAAGVPAPLTTSARSISKSSGASSAKFKNPGDGVVNLNTANAGELTKLPGVGPSTAAKIVEYRQQIGKFSDASQIQDVKGIGPKKYEKMRAFLTVK